MRTRNSRTSCKAALRLRNSLYEHSPCSGSSRKAFLKPMSAGGSWKVTLLVYKPLWQICVLDILDWISLQKYAGRFLMNK